MYSFGNGSGVGRGLTEPRQTTPWLIEGLEKEIIIDICTGDGNCLALTQSMQCVTLVMGGDFSNQIKDDQVKWPSGTW